MSEKSKGCSLYRHWDVYDNLLYVGISNNFVERLAQHKEGAGWYKDIYMVTIEHFETREEALLREAEAIRTEKPLHNVKHNKPVKNTRKRIEYRTCIDNSYHVGGDVNITLIAVENNIYKRLTYDKEVSCTGCVFDRPEIGECHLARIPEHRTDYIICYAALRNNGIWVDITPEECLAFLTYENNRNTPNTEREA
jgi:predicted GIY-YIG superfamily endonuclease